MREDFFDPDLANVSITISEISVSPDLSNARVYTMPLGGVKVETVLPALNRLAPVIQSLVAKKVHLRRTPRLWFLLDESFENAARMNQLFRAIKQDS
jgi:ribosome-binding factor A